jgi:hypothetical protein
MSTLDTIRQLAHELGADVEEYADTDRHGHALDCVDVYAPLGQRWVGAGEAYEDSHCLYVCWRTDTPEQPELRAERLRSLLEWMRQGLGACTDPECFPCRAGGED